MFQITVYWLNLGIPDDILGMIENLLAGRSMRVKVGDEYS